MIDICDSAYTTFQQVGNSYSQLSEYLRPTTSNSLDFLESFLSYAMD